MRIHPHARKLWTAVLAAAAALGAGAAGSTVPGAPPEPAEPGSIEAIAAATTEARFSSPWVSYVPASPGIPTPMEHLGHVVGAPGELTGTAEIYSYYRALAAASPHVQVEVIGTSEEGRDLLLVIVGEEEDLQHLDRYREAMADLADPRRCDDACAGERIAAVKPFYMLHGGLHSTETGSPEMLMELTHRLATSEAEHVREIRDHVIVLINPLAEPDGHDRMVEWFYRHLKGRTDFDDLPPRSPPYWGKYVFHDNNRDGVQRKLALTRATQDAFLRWQPIVLHDLHESIPLLLIWTGTGPYNVNLEPSVFSEWHTIAFYEVAALTAMGMPGVWTYGFGEGWAHVYQDSVAINHNAIGRGYETFGNATAETVERSLDPQRMRYAGRPVTERDWYRMVPPPRRFRWSLRNNVNYMQTGVLAALQYAARNHEAMLRNFYLRGAEGVRRGAAEKPHAIAIPEAQDDRRRLARLVNLLREHGIEVSRLTGDLAIDDETFPAGTFLVRMDQPYRGYALDLLTPQRFPIDEAPHGAYDDVAWALPVSLGIEVTPIGDPSVLAAPVAAVEDRISYRGRAAGGGVRLLRDRGQEALLEARVRLASFRIEAAEQPFSAGGADYPAGSWILPSQPGLEPALRAVAADLALDFDAVGAAPDVRRHDVDLPRLAVLQTWDDTEAAGWARMILDDEGVPYTLIMDGDVRQGGLGKRFDLILMPHTSSGFEEIVAGIDPRFSPLAYTKTAAFPSHGSPTSSPDITGGIGWTGMQHIEDFVRQGGILMTLGGASTLALDSGLARGVRRARSGDLENPGSELRVRFPRIDHPIAYGYPETTSVFREDRTVYDVRPADRERVVLQWGTAPPSDDEEEEEPDDGGSDTGKPAEPPLVVSGGIQGGGALLGKPAVLDIPMGGGRVIAFNFDPLHRYQTESDFRLVWNIVLNWNDLPPP